MEPRPVWIYALTDPTDGRVRYVGKTVCPKERLQRHLWAADREDSYLYRWLRLLKSQGLTPGFTLLEQTTEQDWQERERFWIASFRAASADLVNVAEGGIAPNGWDADVEQARRQKVSAARLGMKFTEEHRQHLSDRKRKHFEDPTHRAQVARERAKLTDEQVLEIWKLAHEAVVSQQAIADRFGIPNSTVSDIKRGKRFKYLTAALADTSDPRRLRGEARAAEALALRGQGQSFEEIGARLGVRGDSIINLLCRHRRRAGAPKQPPRLTTEQVMEIRRRFAAGETPRKQLAEEFGVSRQLVYHVTRDSSSPARRL